MADEGKQMQLDMSQRELIGWGFAAAGGIFAVFAAALQGGTVAALTAASAGCTAIAGAFGYANKTTATKA